MHGEPKYGPDFEHFDYVNTDAPKGGRVRLAASGTFDSFNPLIIKGVPAAGTGFLFETLLTSSSDEAFTEYGLIAESIEWPEDRSWVIFNLRPEARWHDGKPITAEDVVYSFDILRSEGHPTFRFYYQSVLKAEVLDEHKVKFTFAEGDNRELPLIIGQLPILPKHYWEDREFARTTLQPPLGSGPYRIEAFEPGRFVVYQRVEDYWGKDLPVNRGRYNFDTMRYDYYLDDTVIREAVKARAIDFRQENQAKAWALDYNTPAVRAGWLRLEEFENERPTGMQGFVMNTRRPVFRDPRVREALSYAFDFDWTNRNLFFDQYTRTESYFSNSDLASRGIPTGRELRILEDYRGRVPEEVFEQEFAPPSTDGTGWPRENLARAFELFAEAGWVVRDMQLVNAETGEQMRFEILLVSPAFERIALPYVHNLRRLGIDVNVRLVDAAQYQQRTDNFDFDMIVTVWGQSDSPGNEQRDFWGSAAADQPGSRNLAGIKDEVVDALIERLIAAPDRESLIARTRALDRVLLWGHYVVPHWHVQQDRVVFWDKFGRPEITPKDGVDLLNWWIDPAKQRALATRGRQQPSTTEAQGQTPDGTLAMVMLGALFILGYFVFRRAIRKTSS